MAREWTDSVAPLSVLHLPDANHLFLESRSPDQQESYLTQLWTALYVMQKTVPGRQGTVRYTIGGMGGVGKTQLALAYAHEAYLHGAYDVICWVNSETEETLLQDYKKLLASLELSVPTGSGEVIGQVRLRLPEKSKRWLIIYDNVPSFDFLKDKVPQKGGHALVTSRDEKGWHGQLHLEVFRPEEAVRYLLASTKRGDREENRAGALAVATAVGCLPLALAQAAGYMEENPELSFQDYHAIFQRKAAELLSYRPEGEEYPRTVATTWAMTKEKLRHPLSNWLLTIFSYLGPDQINPEWFLPLVEGNERGREGEIRKAIRELQRYSMVKYNEKEQRVSLHRLVQQVGRLDHQKTGEVARVLGKIIEQWARWWEEKSSDYGPGLFLIEFAMREVTAINALSYNFYPHMTYLERHIQEITGINREERERLLRGSRRIKESLELVMDTTHACILSSCIVEKGSGERAEDREARGIERIGAAQLPGPPLFPGMEHAFMPPVPGAHYGMWEDDWPREDDRGRGGSPLPRREVREHKLPSELLMSVLSQGLSSCGRDECKFLFEVAEPLFPSGIKAAECLSVMESLRHIHGASRDDREQLSAAAKAAIKEIVEVAVKFKGEKQSVADLQQLISMASSGPPGQKEVFFLKMKEIMPSRALHWNLQRSIKEAVNKVYDKAEWPSFAAQAKRFLESSSSDEKTATYLKVFSRIFPASWDTFHAQVSQLITDSMTGDQQRDLMEAFAGILTQDRPGALSCTQQLRQPSASAEDVIKIVRVLGSLGGNREAIVRIVSRHPEVADLNLKSDLMMALRGFHQIPDINDILRYASPFLKPGVEEIQGVLQTISSMNAEERKAGIGALTYCTAGKKIPMTGKDFADLVKVLLKFQHIPYTDEVFRYAHLFFNSSAEDLESILQAISSMKTEERKRVMDALAFCVAGKERGVGGRQFAHLVEMVRETPVEGIEELISSLSSIALDGVVPLKVKTPPTLKMSWERVDEVTLNYSFETRALAKSFIHENMTTHEATLLHAEIDGLPREKKQAVAQIQKIVDPNLCASFYLKFLRQAKRLSVPEWEMLIERVGSFAKGIFRRLQLVDIEDELKGGDCDPSLRSTSLLAGHSVGSSAAFASPYGLETCELASWFIHDKMTPHEAMLLHAEIERIPGNKKEFIEKVQQAASEKMDASVYLKIFGIAKRLSTPKWALFVERVKDKKFTTRTSLHILAEEIEEIPVDSSICPSPSFVAASVEAPAPPITTPVVEGGEPPRVVASPAALASSPMISPVAKEKGTPSLAVTSSQIRSIASSPTIMRVRGGPAESRASKAVKRVREESISTDEKVGGCFCSVNPCPCGVQ